MTETMSARFNKTSPLFYPLLTVFGKTSYYTLHPYEIILSYMERFSFLPFISSFDHVFSQFLFNISLLIL